MKEDIQLGRDFWLSEFLQSETALRHGIAMTPPPSVIDNLSRLVTDVLQPLRDRVGRPVIVGSGYRPRVLNRLVNGADESAHIYGRAGDITVPGIAPVTVATIALGIRDIDYDKLILEFPPDGWVHIQVAQVGRVSRRRAFTAQRHNEKTIYLQGIVA